MPELRRDPPAAVRRQLRQEVGLGCPVPGCGSPYLTWHHFDPPWNVRKHHDPAGMVALCRDCHPQADGGAFTDEQLREFKRRGRGLGPLGGRFNWMRQQLVAVVGGNFYVECPIALRVQNLPVVWFNRDEHGNVLVNLQQLTTSGEPRMLMIDNFWITEGSAEHDIECPPRGRLVKASYRNGDRLQVEFRSHESWDAFDRRYPVSDLARLPRPKLPPDAPPEVLEWERERREKRAAYRLPPHSEHAERAGVQLPVTTVEVEMAIAGTDLKLGARSMTLPGANTFTGCWFAGGRVGVQIGDSSAAA